MSLPSGQDIEGDQLSGSPHHDRAPAGETDQASRIRWRLPPSVRESAFYVIAVGAFVGLWAIVASRTEEFLIPSPAEVVAAGTKMLQSGDLWPNVLQSYQRVIIGWIVGCLVAIPFGMLAGRTKPARYLLDPLVNFFRFIPPIALIGLTIIWFGVGELAKVVIVAYAAFFSAFLEVFEGSARVPEVKLRAGRMLGAKGLRLFRRVILPQTVPSILTGVRVGLGFAFMALVAAELLAANVGVGFVIYNSRLFAQTSRAFVGIVLLGGMGFLADRLFLWATIRLRRRFGLTRDS